MKKYVKPELIFESFELSQQIAACQYDGTKNDGPFVGFNNDFGEEMSIFLIKGVCEVVVESYCYHNASSGAYGIFNS